MTLNWEKKGFRPCRNEPRRHLFLSVTSSQWLRVEPIEPPVSLNHDNWSREGANSLNCIHNFSSGEAPEWHKEKLVGSSHFNVWHTVGCLKIQKSHYHSFSHVYDHLADGSLIFVLFASLLFQKEECGSLASERLRCVQRLVAARACRLFAAEQVANKSFLELSRKRNSCSMLRERWEWTKTLKQWDGTLFKAS